MMNCAKDTGLTYSSPEYRSSVAVVYKATSFKEFVNTLSHEVAHICAHITKAFVIKLTEEEFCYMLGDLMADVSDLIFDEAHR
jgi:predicted SprT family Zn-dependent metalloprotease